MNNSDFGRTMENVRKRRDIKFFTTERRKKYLVSEPKTNTADFFREKLLATEIEKKILMSKPVYL